MTPETKPQNVSDKLIQEFLDKGGKIQQIPAGQRTEVETKTSFYGKRNKKAEEASESTVDKNR